MPDSVVVKVAVPSGAAGTKEAVASCTVAAGEGVAPDTAAARETAVSGATVAKEAVRAGAASKPAVAAGPATVEVDRIRFAWKAGERDVLDIARFEVAAGERVFVEGPSGSGKSTLLGLLGGVAGPREGTVRILGTELSAMPARRRDRFRADHVGFIFQMFNLVPYLSMIDNVTLPCRFSRRRRECAGSRAGGIEAEARRLLARLELDRPELLSRAVTDLSIGQQQRVAAARALIGAPELLIADEPTSALDEGTRERFLDLLFAQCGEAGAALLFASHDTRLGARFDRRVSIAELGHGEGGGNGRIPLHGNSRQARKRPSNRHDRTVEKAATS